jgi:hypothetical protein
MLLCGNKSKKRFFQFKLQYASLIKAQERRIAGGAAHKRTQLLNSSSHFIVSNAHDQTGGSKRNTHMSKLRIQDCLGQRELCPREVSERRGISQSLVNNRVDNTQVLQDVKTC